MGTGSLNTCRYCLQQGEGVYCSACGQKYNAGKITFSSLLHEVVHFFTHLDKGFGYTIKLLAKQPGKMQREYIEGLRGRHQKPFSFFFICGSFCGLAFYLINVVNRKLNNHVDISEEDFFRHYFILLQAFLLPVYTFMLWLMFMRAKYNYAEVLVLMLYHIGFIFLAFIPINILELVFPEFDTRYIELTFLVFYNIATNLNFFIRMPRWLNIILSLLVLLICYAASQLISNYAIENL